MIKIQCQELKDNFSDLIIDIQGASSRVISNLAPLSDSTAKDLTFINQERYIGEAKKCLAGAILVSPSLAPKISSESRTLLISHLPELALAKIAVRYFQRRPENYFRGIHATAQLADTVELGKNVCVGPFAVIGENVKIGDSSYIGAHSVIEEGCLFGNNVRIEPQVFIGAQTRIGSHCVVQAQAVVGVSAHIYTKEKAFVRMPALGRVILADYVEIGAQSSILRGPDGNTLIGEGTKVDNHCHIKSNCCIGKHNIMTAGAIVGHSSKIGNHCVFGGNSTIEDGVEIGDRVHLAGLTLVSENLLNPGVYGGHPTQPLASYLKTLSSLPHLPSIRRDIMRLKKELGSVKE